MRFAILCAAALLLTMFSGQDAQAARGGGVWGTAEQMSLVAPTDITNNSGQPLALCHLTKKTHIMFAGVWRSSKGYVMAPNNCDSDNYYSVSAEQLAAGKALGKYPADLPDQPAMSIADIFSGFWGLGVIALLLLVAVVKSARQAKRTAQRHAQMGDIHPAALRAMDAMCHAAKADGRLDPSEITLMADIAKQITGETFDEARIRRMFDMAEAKPTEAQFAAFGTGLTSDQKRMVLQATVMIAAADGHMDQDETLFVQKLARGLGFNVDEFMTMLQAMKANPA
jgi:tellurite resistance protein